MESLDDVRRIFENSAFNKHLNIHTDIFEEGTARCRCKTSILMSIKLYMAGYCSACLIRSWELQSGL